MEKEELQNESISLTPFSKAISDRYLSYALSTITSRFSHITEDKAKHFALTGILFAVVFPFLPFTDRYFMDVAIMILTYIML